MLITICNVIYYTNISKHITYIPLHIDIASIDLSIHKKRM